MPIRSNLSFKSEFPTCSICNEPVELETTKSNEIGEPIHEECYALELSLGKATRPPPEARRSSHLPRFLLGGSHRLHRNGISVGCAHNFGLLPSQLI
jgi:hypothetical protein